MLYLRPIDIQSSFLGIKLQVNDPCDSKNCGSKCKCMSLLGTEKYACDCTIEGKY